MERINLNVPFSQKDEAKKKGAKWDPTNKTWYIFVNMHLQNFNKWLPFSPNVKASNYFIAEKEITCWKCRDTTPIYAIYLEEYDWLFDDELDGKWEKYDCEFFVSYLSEVDSKAIEHIKTITNNLYRLDATNQKYATFSNHCFHCNNQIKDYLIHEKEHGSGFVIGSKEHFQTLRFYPINEAIILQGNVIIRFLFDDSSNTFEYMPLKNLKANVYKR